jgi:hypothetical protein
LAGWTLNPKALFGMLMTWLAVLYLEESSAEYAHEEAHEWNKVHGLE